MRCLQRGDNSLPDPADDRRYVRRRRPGVLSLVQRLVNGESPSLQGVPIRGLTVRCLQRADSSLPEPDDDVGTFAYVARAY